MKYLLVLILVVSFSSCTNYDEKMRKFDASFTKMRKITSANVLNHELILGRPYIIHYADSSVVIYDDINDSIFTLIDLRDNNSVYQDVYKRQGLFVGFLPVLLYSSDELELSCGIIGNSGTNIRKSYTPSLVLSRYLYHQKFNKKNRVI